MRAFDIGQWSEDEAVAYCVKLRWPDGPACPRCGCGEYSFLQTRRLWKCRACRYQYSVRVGTILERSHLTLCTWLRAIWLEANGPTTSRALGQALGLHQDTANQLLRRIRIGMSA